MDRKGQKPRVTLRTTVWGSRNTSVHSVAMENSNYGCVGYSLTVSHAGDTLWPGIQTLLKEADFESANSLLVPKRLSRVHRNTINSCWRVCTEFWGGGRVQPDYPKGLSICTMCPMSSGQSLMLGAGSSHNFKQIYAIIYLFSLPWWLFPLQGHGLAVGASFCCIWARHGLPLDEKPAPPYFHPLRTWAGGVRGGHRDKDGQHVCVSAVCFHEAQRQWHQG